ncbi:YybS family protein [Shouchella clausii]|uniref:YybS family protein n=2 Tax=Shouchella clausii TaxID=79880 RepID=UPI000BA5FAB3|nr:YybS family protein [Shouchella clausii]MED4160661.1 YybS family protein [Shouchella clausii]PAD07524.1 hypothetical protein CHH76_19365 [Shouchella clausii]PAF03657.1 hypothetical protein CHH66_18945 [Shouchella clausii]PTL21461.1 DUF2232 domain-containing protein [Shouchella clausii]
MEHRNQLMKGLLCGVIYIALFMIFAFNIPLLNMFALIAMPLPVVYFTAIFGPRPGMVLTAAVGLLGTIATLNPLAAFAFAVIGYVLGYAQHKHRKGAELLLATIVASFVFLSAAYILLTAVTDLSVLQFVRESLQETQQLLSELGMESYDEAFIEEYVQLIESLMTFLLLLMAAVYAFLVYGAATMLFKRVDLPYHKLPKFREWAFPRFFLWFYFSLLLLSFLPFEPGSYMAAVTQTGINLVSVLLIIQGVSLLFVYLQARRLAKGVSVFIIIMVVISLLLVPFLLWAMKMIGVLDMVLRIRDRMKL